MQIHELYTSSEAWQNALGTSLRYQVPKIVPLSSTLYILVQSLNSPFFPPLVGAESGRAKEESRTTCMTMLRTPPFFPQIGGKTIFGSTFQIRLLARFSECCYGSQVLNWTGAWLSQSKISRFEWIISARAGCKRKLLGLLSKKTLHSGIELISEFPKE